MGYRSYGCIRISAPARRMVYHLGRMKLESPDPAKLEEILKRFILNEQNGGLLLLCLDYYDWKWYSEYPDINMIESIWSHFAALDEPEISGAFVRCGEDPEDTEKRYFGDDAWELADVVRSIESVPADAAANLLIDNRLSTIDCSEPQGDSNADHELVPLEASGLREVQVPGLVEARPEDPRAGAPVATGED